MRICDFFKPREEFDQEKRETLDFLAKGLAFAAGYPLIKTAENLIGGDNAYAQDANTPIVEMYDWDGVCRDKNEYNSKVPAAYTISWSAEPEDFLKAINNDDNVFNTLKKHGLIEPIKAIQESNTDYLDRVTITDNFLEFGINSTNDNYSNMSIKGDSRYFVFERLGKKDINKLRPYFD